MPWQEGLALLSVLPVLVVHQCTIACPERIFGLKPSTVVKETFILRLRNRDPATMADPKISSEVKAL